MYSRIDNRRKEIIKLIACIKESVAKRKNALSESYAYYVKLEHAQAKLDELNAELQQSDAGHDLLSCQDWILKQQMLENEVVFWDEKINDLVHAGEGMANDSHFDGDGFVNPSQFCKKRFEEFKGTILRITMIYIVK